MISAFYLSVFIISLLLTLVYIYKWHKHFDVNFTLIFTIVPVACLGYWFYSLSDNLREAVIASRITYIGGCFLQLFILFSIFNLCKIEINNKIRVAMFAICGLMYMSVLSIGYSDLYYRNMTFEIVDGNPVLTRQYGPAHTIFYLVIFIMFAAGIAAIIYSLKKRKQVPRSVIYLLVIPDIICIFGFYVGRRIIRQVDLVPLVYVIAEFVYILIAYRVNLYDISDTVIDSYVKEERVAYLSFDFKYRYLGCNESAGQILPEIGDLAVDETLGDLPTHRKIRHFLDRFRQDEKNDKFVYSLPDEDGNSDNDKFFNVNVNYLYDGNIKRGYIITFTDDTVNRKYIRLIDDYNDKLQREVEEKTRHIVEMHDNLIMSLAMMVESRDNSTGGHIKRTSVGVKILIDEIIKEKVIPVSEEFCRDVVKSAPMHDLGKIAVDDAVLRKPGKFTDEEFEKMKCHAEEGARVIHEILLHTDDESFKKIAENVAHYHHERWDGSGYPKKLSKEQIPLEARIMAIADVYDALVSKRVYKEAFDFEKADRIIMEGMGSQFDPGLRSAYEKARPRLEEYYRDL